MEVLASMFSSVYDGALRHQVLSITNQAEKLLAGGKFRERFAALIRVVQLPDCGFESIQWLLSTTALGVLGVFMACQVFALESLKPIVDIDSVDKGGALYFHYKQLRCCAILGSPGFLWVFSLALSGRYNSHLNKNSALNIAHLTFIFLNSLNSKDLLQHFSTKLSVSL
jgi:hypothetical protein